MRIEHVDGGTFFYREDGTSNFVSNEAVEDCKNWASLIDPKTVEDFYSITMEGHEKVPEGTIFLGEKPYPSKESILLGLGIEK